MAVKILHTSDWHLGRNIYGRKRTEEFKKFLTWLVDLIMKESVDILLIAGDIFDSASPGTAAQSLYYRFLWRVSSETACHVVITAGNHDSPSFLSAPSGLLAEMRIHIIGSPGENPEDEVVVINLEKDRMLLPETGRAAVVCAVPFLRDRDVRTSFSGETSEQKNLSINRGIIEHYKRVCGAGAPAAGTDPRKPLIAMGHLFTSGGITLEGDGVRDLYIGSLAHVNATLFPDSIDYFALGHLHSPQRAGGRENIRYSGSPLPMSFGESGKEKSVVIVEFDESDSAPEIRIVGIPVFQKLQRISGTIIDVFRALEKLKESESSVWLEIELKGTSLPSGLREEIENLVRNTNLEILRLRISDTKTADLITDGQMALEELNESDVFEKLLDLHEINGSERNEIKSLFLKVLDEFHQTDPVFGVKE